MSSPTSSDGSGLNPSSARLSPRAAITCAMLTSAMQIMSSETRGVMRGKLERRRERPRARAKRDCSQFRQDFGRRESTHKLIAVHGQLLHVENRAPRQDFDAGRLRLQKWAGGAVHACGRGRDDVDGTVVMLVQGASWGPAKLQGMGSAINKKPSVVWWCTVRRCRAWCEKDEARYEKS